MASAHFRAIDEHIRHRWKALRGTLCSDTVGPAKAGTTTRAFDLVSKTEGNHAIALLRTSKLGSPSLFRTF